MYLETVFVVITRVVLCYWYLSPECFIRYILMSSFIFSLSSFHVYASFSAVLMLYGQCWHESRWMYDACMYVHVWCLYVCTCMMHVCVYMYDACMYMYGACMYVHVWYMYVCMYMYDAFRPMYVHVCMYMCDACMYVHVW